MKRSAPLSPGARRGVSIMATVGFLVATFTFAGAVAAHPSTATTLTYHFTDCIGPAGTPEFFDALKQPGSAAALHLVDGSGIFVAVQAIDTDSGTILFTTPGFQHNNLPTVSCELIHPVTNAHQSVIGFIAPVG